MKLPDAFFYYIFNEVTYRTVAENLVKITLGEIERAVGTITVEELVEEES
mgnify:CR=1 FL=1